MRSSRVVRTSDNQCRSRNCTGFDPSILRHSGIWGAADEAVLNIAHKNKNQKIPVLGMFLTALWIRIKPFRRKTVRFQTFYDVTIAFVGDFVHLRLKAFDIIILLHVNNAGPLPYFKSYRAFFWYGTIPYPTYLSNSTLTKRSEMDVNYWFRIQMNPVLFF